MLDGQKTSSYIFHQLDCCLAGLLMSLSVFSAVGFPADIFGDLFGGMFGGGPFGGGPFGFGSRGSRRKQKGEDIVHQLKSVSFIR